MSSVVTTMKIIADYHIHTNNSDGKNTVEDVVRAAAKAGLKEIAITDHGHGKWFGGLSRRTTLMFGLIPIVISALMLSRSPRSRTVCCE